MFSFSPKRAILLALAQVWVIAVGTLAAALVVRLTEEGIFSPYHLPLAAVFLVQAGVTFLILPLAWTWAVFYLRIQTEVRVEYKERAYYVGWVILGILVLFIGFGTLRPVYGFFFEPCAVK